MASLDPSRIATTPRSCSTSEKNNNDNSNSNPNTSHANPPPKRKTSEFTSSTSEIDSSSGHNSLELAAAENSHNKNNMGSLGISMTHLNRTKKKGVGRRTVFWLFILLLVIVAFILIEDETELRQSNAYASDVTWKGPQLTKDSFVMPSATSTKNNHRPQQQQQQQSQNGIGTTQPGNNNRLDDDLVQYWWGQRSDRLAKEKEKKIKMIKQGNKKTTKTATSSSSSLLSTTSTSTTKLPAKGTVTSEKSKADASSPRSSMVDPSTVAQKKLQPFPVISSNDDSIPHAAGGLVLHASDALLCRDSVIDYVINATDLKDECDGLKKAFTKHCSDEVEHSASSSSLASPQDQRNRQRRRILTEQNTKKRNPILYLQSRIYHLSKDIKSWWCKPPNPMFMAEDEILDAWDDAAFEVKQGWDYLVYRNEDIASILHYEDNFEFNMESSIIESESSSHPWEIPHMDEKEYSYKDKTETIVIEDLSSPLSRTLLDRQVMRRRQGVRNLNRQAGNAQNDHNINKDEEEEEEESDDQEEEEQEEDELIDEQEEGERKKKAVPIETTTKPDAGKLATNATKTSSTGKHVANLALPTTVKHVSDKMLTETLMLQQDHSKLVKAAHNHTNHTTAQADAAASAKAVSDATDVVSTLLNDPTSVEARTCCTSILNVFHENCSVDEEEELSDSRLIVSVTVIALCGLVKSLIRHFSIRWLPEAAGCILVGVIAGYLLTYFPHHDMSFDGNWFLRIMVPPIVFEAALSIDKRSFHRHLIPILFYAVIGTLMASAVTAYVVHEGSVYFRAHCEPIPYPEALAFGALISSIDPIAVLSVLSNMGMTDLDTIYVVIFGESLLNDGVAIVLFETLVHFLDDNMEVDRHAVMAATVHFLVVFIGSLLIGIGSGLCCTLYYWLMHGCQTPLVEVLMFCCWALLPYYVCDGIEWSGIVSVVAAGFIMDMYVVGTHIRDQPLEPSHDSLSCSHHISNDSFSDYDTDGNKDRRRRLPVVRRPIFSKEGLLGEEAKTHIGFVTEIIATMMETAIFAYLGLFLFSSRYHWNVYHVAIAIAGCCLSRAVMIPTLSYAANSITKMQQVRDNWRSQQLPQQSNHLNTPQKQSNNAAGVIIDHKMQLVLWFAGLRGAMSFALVEHIPLYDAVTGEGTRLKSELKAMTSASIIFTVFIMGGGTYYMMEALGLAPKHTNENGKGGERPSLLEREMEMMGLLRPGPNDTAENYFDGETNQLFDEKRTEVFKPSTPAGQSNPRRPGRPVRRQRKLVDM